MIAALATLAFLAAAWVVVMALAETLRENGSKVAAALRGQSVAAQPALCSAPVRISARYPASQPQRARPRPAMRAAA